ncbi:MAG: sel1 repeat family protein [Planctomycetaceae bacterium]|nr:sel1 repeat family protein [Planctomycetaceae bacterium]
MQTRLGWELISGNRTQEERTVGLAYLKSAASSGSLWARYFLASDKIAIREGKKVSEDQFEEGLSEFRELSELCKFATERNDPRAEFILAECYQYGYGVSRDVSEARRYYSRAWIHGDQTGLSAMHLTLLYSLEANRSPEMKELHQLWRERARWEGIDRIAADW